MRTAIGYSVAVARYAEITVSIGQAYRTKKPCVALRFNPAGKPAIVFLPQGAILRVIQPSSCVREGFEVVFGEEVYNVFKVDLLTSEKAMALSATESETSYAFTFWRPDAAKLSSPDESEAASLPLNVGSLCNPA